MFLWKNYTENVRQNLAPHPFFILLNNPKKGFLKKDYQKAFKNLILVFLSTLVPFNGQSYQKQKGSGTSHQSIFKSQNKFRTIPLFFIYCLTMFDDVT